MRTAQVDELKDRLDEVIAAVKNGEMVEIRDGDVALAELVPSLIDSDWLESMFETKAMEAQPVNPGSQDWQSFFLNNLSLVERLIAFVCRKNGITGADAEDFASDAKLKLIEDNYAVLRKFEGRCSLPTYLTIIIQRYYLEQKIQEWGKWRPSLQARQRGDAAILLERLISRDGLERVQALEIVRQKYPEADSQTLGDPIPKAHLDDLVRQGKARRGTGPLPADFFTRPLPEAKRSVLEALLEDRRFD
jgi:antitoxin (DNA-binding transcriptional repressor) of toxin-antitoxin stability system